MKKSMILVLCVAMIFVMTGCSGISKEDYEKVVSERDEYKTKYEAELEKNKKLDSEYAEIKQIYENIVGDNSDLGFVNELTRIRKDYEEIANHPEAHYKRMERRSKESGYHERRAGYLDNPKRNISRKNTNAALSNSLGGSKSR